MPIVVQKYGGSSVADVERIRKVAEKVAAAKRAGRDVCVVVSAMGDTTDELLALAKKVSAAPPRRELDMLLTAGERISMALLSMALNDQGVEAISFTGSQSGIITTDSHSAARILEVRPIRVHEELGRGKVVIVAGYQGVSQKKEVTTLGRGGSDTTAVALAAALGGDCEIYSDVDGVYSADPRVVPNAKRLAELSYDEMQEMAQAGAKVLNAQAVEFAKEKGIAVFARSTFGGGEGTVVRDGAGARPERVVAVTGQRDLALLSVSDGRLEVALALLEKHGAVASQIAHHGERVTLLLPLDDVHAWPTARAELERELGNGAVDPGDWGAVSVVGTGLCASYRVLREVTTALAALGASPRATFTSALRVTACCPANLLDEAVRRLHQALIA
jgi:aspartate kinase